MDFLKKMIFFLKDLLKQKKQKNKKTKKAKIHKIEIFKTK